LLGLIIVAPGLSSASGMEVSALDLFRSGTAEYRAGRYPEAALLLQQSAELRPGSGTLLNLGNAQWQCGHAGIAVLAWERALWLNPLNGAARNNLRFARKTAQLESPELAWFEVVSTWLPMNWWVWISGLSFWFAISLGMLPGILRLRKAAWHQALAALGLAIFLLSIPAQFGVGTRSRIGFVLQKDTPLRLTPTQDAQFITRMSSGEPARVERVRGNFLLLRTNRALGWVTKSEFGILCPRS
jgi:hypothetical protein